MKTISLGVDERIYPQVVDFLRLLPEDRCHVFDEEDSPNPDELSEVRAIQARLLAGDENEFVDWDDIKGKL